MLSTNCKPNSDKMPSNGRKLSIIANPTEAPSAQSPRMKLTASQIINLVRILALAAGSFAFAFTDFMKDHLNGRYRYIFIAVISAWLIWSIFLFIKNLKNSNHES